MGGNLYMMDATRMLTALAVDLGEKPAVPSAIAKYHLTDRARQVINDAMDVAGGKGICMGPSNFLGAAYMQLPVSITVEGANILTRSLIIFGQGAIRCHPYVLKEIEATRETDRERASIAFDQALFGHIGFVLSNMARSLVMGLCGSRCAVAPDTVAPETRRYYQQLTRFSAVLAFLSDVSMGSLGGALKRKEKLSARLGDILSMLYLCSATLKRYETEGRQASDAPLMHWAIWDAMFKAQNAIEGVISNFPNRFIAAILRRLVFPLGRPYVVPSDELGHAVAKLLIEPSATRDRLTAGMFVSSNEENPVGAIELALAATLVADPIEAKIKEAVRAGRLSVKARDDRIAAAQAAGVITAEESMALRRAQRLVDKVVRVDDFPPDLGASEMRLPGAVLAHKAAA
jgi:acyl-CoA dehydrogenase